MTVEEKTKKQTKSGMKGRQQKVGREKADKKTGKMTGRRQTKRWKCN